jgi:pSer/pThr/pTyr-binding forkhead associated (FHA) protein
MQIYSIGRKGSNIVVPDAQKQVSRRHAELTVTNQNTYYLVDANSSNGTYLKRDGKWVPLRQGFVQPQDEVRFGAKALMRVSDLLQQARGVAAKPETELATAVRN